MSALCIERMPSGNICCEFCKKDVRKDTYMTHVNAKHTKDVAMMILKDFETSDINPIAQSAASKNPRIMVIHSMLYEEHEYWFGVKPMFWKNGAKGYSEYVRTKENIDEHGKHIEILLSEITLQDFIATKKNLIIKNPDAEMMKQELKRLQLMYDTEKEKAQTLISTLTTELEDYKLHVETPLGVVSEMEHQITHMRCIIEKLKVEQFKDKREIEMLKKNSWENDEAVRSNYLADIKYWQTKSERYEFLYNELQKEITEQKEAINSRIAKKMEKEEERKQKEAEREKEREQKEFRKTEEKYKKMLKRMGKGATEAESESDSE